MKFLKYKNIPLHRWGRVIPHKEVMRSGRRPTMSDMNEDTVHNTNWMEPKIIIAEFEGMNELASSKTVLL